MKTGIAMMLAALAALPAMAQPMKQELPGWMTGAWERVADGQWGDEFWTPPRGDIMIGSSRSGKGEKLTFWEHMRIVREADGQIAFWAVAGNQAPVRFPATVVGANEIMFENAAHDYPQRIRYWRDGRQLRAEIALIDGSKAQPYTFVPMGTSAAKN